MNKENTNKKENGFQISESLGSIIFTVVLLGLMWAASKWLF